MASNALHYQQKTLPTVTELVARAVVQTRFHDEISDDMTHREIFRAATIATDQAAEMWEEDNGLPVGETVPDSTRDKVARKLMALANAEFAAAEAATEEALAAVMDAIAAGDLDRFGEPRPYATSWSA